MASIATRSRTGTPALGEFLDTLETRLRALGAEGTITALLAHAQRLPASARREFLAIFPGTATPTTAPDGGRLLADIDAFAQRARDDEFLVEDHDDDWYYDRNDDGYRADAEWVAEADALFAAAAGEFLAGRLDAARQAYQRLFGVFRLSYEGGGDLELWRLQDTDLGEAAARYLRCVYDTAPARQRAHAVHQEYVALCPRLPGRPPMLGDIAGARRGTLHGLAAFLSGWIDALLDADPAPGETPTASETPALPAGLRRRLLAEAALLHGGVDALAEVCRRPGAHQPGVYLDWIDALCDAGYLDQAADAAREALALTRTDPHHQAQAADRLADLATRLDNPTEAVHARQRAWRTDRTRTRLVALATTTQAAGTAAKTLAAEARHYATGTDRLTCELFLLAGRVDTAAAALTQVAARGWSQPTHPGPVVLPYLLVAATGASPPTADTRLGHLFASIDTIPEITYYLRQEVADLQFEDADDADPDDDDPDSGGPGAPGSLVELLADQITATPGPAKRRQQWLTTAATIIEQRVEAIVSNKNRGAYARAADLVVAYAETQIITGTGNGHDYIAGMRQRYPRHTAFRAELDTAARASELIRPGSAAGARRGGSRR